MIFSEGKEVSPLFSPLNSSGNALSQFMRSIGKQLPEHVETNGSLALGSKRKIPIPKESKSISPTKTQTESRTHRETTLLTHPFPNQRAKELSRWETFTKQTRNDSQTGETTSNKGIWNYLLSESKEPSFVSYHTREKKENLEMVVEPKDKGFTLYVFWKAEGFGPYGIFFYYQPEETNPVRIEIVTSELDRNSDPTFSLSLKQKLQDLLRVFPQIGDLSFEDWKESSYNGDYR